MWKGLSTVWFGLVIVTVFVVETQCFLCLLLSNGYRNCYQCPLLYQMYKIFHVVTGIYLSCNSVIY